MSDPLAGPAAWRNWRLHLSGAERANQMYEWALYSDAPLVGELVGLGPYSVLNTMNFDIRQTGLLGLAALLRVDLFVRLFDEPTDSLWERTETSRYHGGDLHDEIASLLSLSLGMRCRPGGMTRCWFISDDPLGRPLEAEHMPPDLPAVSNSRLPIVPNLMGEKNLGDALEPMEQYRQLSAADAIALARAARAYAQAVWVAESDPNLAWIQLVGALETAAGRWKPPSATKLERIEEAWPELAALLHDLDPVHSKRGADLLVPVVKSTHRFVQFLNRFAPGPPEQRPETELQVDWDKLEDHLRRVYNYRSRALHSGEPFPPPMSLSPRYGIKDGQPGAERPIGLAAGINDGVWIQEDTPLLLATFEYITREALCTWWRQMPIAEPGPQHSGDRS